MKLKGWLTRDEDGTLGFYYNNKPIRVDGSWINGCFWMVLVDEISDGFPEITWESDPVEVELEIRKI